jgi:DHA1 family bicyclomycin/chloramphenicol resistance-like MFS transporter
VTLAKIEDVAAEATQRTTLTVLLLLVVMTGIAPISLYMLVPALPVIAKVFDSSVSVVQMTVSLFMVGLAVSQLVMGPLSDKFGRRPVLLAGFGLMVAAAIACSFVQTLPQLIGARFLQAVGGATGMVISRAIVRDLYPRERVGGMISLVIAVMMIAQMLSPLAGGLIEHALGWQTIFYVLVVASILVTAAIAIALPETRRTRSQDDPNVFARDTKALLSDRAFIGYVMCQVLASAIIFTFAGGGPYIVISQMHRSAAEYGAWFATSGIAYLTGNLFSARYSQRFTLEQMIWFGLAIQVTGASLNLLWGVTGLNQVPSWLFITHMSITFGNAFVMSNASAGAISVRPQAAGTASGIMGFLQMGFGSLCSQFGAYLGGTFLTPAPLNAAVFSLSLACAAMMIFVVPRRDAVISDDIKNKAEEQEPGLL